MAVDLVRDQVKCPACGSRGYLDPSLFEFIPGEHYYFLLDGDGDIERLCLMNAQSGSFKCDCGNQWDAGLIQDWYMIRSECKPGIKTLTGVKAVLKVKEVNNDNRAN